MAFSGEGRELGTSEAHDGERLLVGFLEDHGRAREPDDLKAVLEAELFADVAEVDLDGARAATDLAGDLLGFETFATKPAHLSLTRRERCERKHMTSPLITYAAKSGVENQEAARDPEIEELHVGRLLCGVAARGFVQSRPQGSCSAFYCSREFMGPWD